MMARMPLRSEPSSSDRSKPRRLSISSWLRMRSVEPASAIAASQSAAMAASVSVGSLIRLLDQHFLDQDGVHLLGRDDQIDPAQNLHPQLVASLAARQVL